MNHPSRLRRLCTAYVAREATWPKRHPRQCRCARTDLDPCVSLGRRVDGEAGKVRWPYAALASGQLVELASIYVQLAASDASYATGQVYGSSGGASQP